MTGTRQHIGGCGQVIDLRPRLEQARQARFDPCLAGALAAYDATGARLGADSGSFRSAAGTWPVFGPLTEVQAVVVAVERIVAQQRADERAAFRSPRRHLAVVR